MEQKEVGGGACRIRLVRVSLRRCLAVEADYAKHPGGAAQLVRRWIGSADREHFVALHLDATHRVVSKEVVSVGTLTSSLVHPREVFKGAILANAAAVICAHNHPSGNVEPSAEDRAISGRLREIGMLLGIPLLDFIVVSTEGFWSGRERDPSWTV